MSKAISCGEETQYITSKSLLQWDCATLYPPAMWTVGNQQWMYSYCWYKMIDQWTNQILTSTIHCCSQICATYISSPELDECTLWGSGNETIMSLSVCSYFWDTPCILWTWFTCLTAKLRSAISLFHSAVPPLLLLHSFIVLGYLHCN